jgi:hypothetical protein
MGGRQKARETGGSAYEGPTAGTTAKIPTEGCDAQDKYLRQLVCQGFGDDILDADRGCRGDVGRAARNLKVGHSLAIRGADDGGMSV